MRRAAAWTFAGLLVLAGLVGWGLTRWQHLSTPHFAPAKIAVASYQARAIAVGSYRAAPSDTGVLVLQSSMMGSGDKGLAAVVVSQFARAVTVAMSYDKFECNGCARTAQGLIGSVILHLHTPLGNRIVIDQLTGKSVRKQRYP